MLDYIREIFDRKIHSKIKRYILFFVSLIGEVVSVPVSETITSIWPLPFGLLLQQAAQPSSTTYVPSLSSSPLFGSSPSLSSLLGRDMLRPRREVGVSPPHNFNFVSAHDHAVKEETSSISSHLILQDPLEEPQVCY